MTLRVTLEDIIVERLKSGRVDRELFELLWELAERNHRVVHVRLKKGSCIEASGVTLCIDSNGLLRVLKHG